MVNFVVIVKNASDLANIQLFGTQDPYVEVATSSDKKRTQTNNNGGKNPRWDEEVRISAPDMNGIMKFTIWNDNIGKDTVIGTAMVDLSALAAFKGVWETTLQVKTAKNKSQGELYVKLTWVA
ncbi:hypothetical protein WA556_003075 [Blastocystis sp. ATCC 50177/Nand II]